VPNTVAPSKTTAPAANLIVDRLLREIEGVDVADIIQADPASVRILSKALVSMRTAIERASYEALSDEDKRKFQLGLLGS
jgi:hypothetical protein